MSDGETCYDMIDMNLFEQATNQYKADAADKKTGSCAHTDVVHENGAMTCTDCGQEIHKAILHEKEWRYYGPADGKRSDPNRVQMRKSEERTIFRDVENMGFSDVIVANANELYADVTKGKIYRGDCRKAIIFACVFHAYKLEGMPQPHEKLTKVFSLTHKVGLRGLKHVSLHASRNSKIHTTYITPAHIVDQIMTKFKASAKDKREALRLCERIKNKSSVLNRARPQSVGSSVVYFWICLKKVDVTLKEFASGPDMPSQLTVLKKAKEIATILGMPDVVQ
jgi:transcription initiation factor TFIIIB Brf1 subunit/transcription initiation factor TFIIB